MTASVDTSTMMIGLREALGASAVERLSGLDDRTRRRIEAGQAEMYPETLSRLREGLAGAARSAGIPTADDATAVIRAVAERRRMAGPLVMLAALELWREGAPMGLADLSERLTGDRDSSPVTAAVKALAEEGLVDIHRPPTGRGVTARWLGERGERR